MLDSRAPGDLARYVRGSPHGRLLAEIAQPGGGFGTVPNLMSVFKNLDHGRFVVVCGLWSNLWKYLMTQLGPTTTEVRKTLLLSSFCFELAPRQWDREVAWPWQISSRKGRTPPRCFCLQTGSIPLNGIPLFRQNNTKLVFRGAGS